MESKEKAAEGAKQGARAVTSLALAISRTKKQATSRVFGVLTLDTILQGRVDGREERERRSKLGPVRSQ